MTASSCLLLLWSIKRWMSTQNKNGPKRQKIFAELKNISHSSELWACASCWRQQELEKTTTAGQTSKEVDRRRHCRKRGRTENWRHCIWKFGKRSRGFLSRYSNLGMIYFQRDGLVWLCQMVGLGSMCNHNCSAAPNICCSKSKVGSKFRNLKTQIGTHLLHVMVTLRFLASGRRSRLHNAVL